MAPLKDSLKYRGRCFVIDDEKTRPNRDSRRDTTRPHMNSHHPLATLAWLDAVRSMGAESPELEAPEHPKPEAARTAERQDPATIA